MQRNKNVLSRTNYTNGAIYTVNSLIEARASTYLIFEFWRVLLFKTYEILCSKYSVKSLFCVLLFKTCLYLK